MLVQTDCDRQRLESSPLTDRIIEQDDADQLYLIYPDLPRSYLYGCPSCGKNMGMGVDGVVVLDDVAWTCNCKDQLQRHKHYLNAGVGATYQFLGWNNFNGDQNALTLVAGYAHDIADNIESGTGLMLSSKTLGTGKTMLGTLVIKSAVMNGYKCFATTFADMLSSMKAGWKDQAFAKWYKQRIDSAQVLMIDDLGKEMLGDNGFNTSMAVNVFDSLLRTRVQQNRPTIITTNYDKGELMRTYGNAVASLLEEQQITIEVAGSDYRPSVSKQSKGYRRIY